MSHDAEGRDDTRENSIGSEAKNNNPGGAISSAVPSPQKATKGKTVAPRLVSPETDFKPNKAVCEPARVVLPCGHGTASGGIAKGMTGETVDESYGRGGHYSGATLRPTE